MRSEIEIARENILIGNTHVILFARNDNLLPIYVKTANFAYKVAHEEFPKEETHVLPTSEYFKILLTNQRRVFDPEQEVVWEEIEVNFNTLNNWTADAEL